MPNVYQKYITKKQLQNFYIENEKCALSKLGVMIVIVNYPINMINNHFKFYN